MYEKVGFEFLSLTDFILLPFFLFLVLLRVQFLVALSTFIVLRPEAGRRGTAAFLLGGLGWKDEESDCSNDGLRCHDYASC